MHTRPTTSHADAQRLAAMLLAPEEQSERSLPLVLSLGPWVGLVLALIVRYI